MGDGAGSLRVVLVSREFPPLFGGGIGTYVWNAARGLAETGCGVRVVTGAREGAEAGEREEARGVLVHRLPMARCGGRWAGRSIGFGVLAAREIARLAHEGRVDVVEFAECEGAGAPWLGLRTARGGGGRGGDCARPGVVVHFHTPTEALLALGSAVRSGMDRELASVVLMERAAIRLADGWCAPSRFIASWAHDWFGLPHPPRVIAYPVGDAVARVAPCTGEKRVLHVGRLEARKGVEALCTAWEPVVRAQPDAVLRLVGADTRTAPGGGSMRDHLLSRMSEAARRRVIFADACRADELARHYAWASLCVVPSLWENFPNTCIEAMTHARPVVVSDRGGMTEMIGDTRAGRVFRAGDGADLARVLNEALREPPWARIERGLIGRKRILELCDPARVARERVAFYGEIVERTRSGVGPAPRGGASEWWRGAEQVVAGDHSAIAVPRLLMPG